MPWLPESVSVLGRSIDFLFYVVLAITGVALVLVLQSLLYFVVRYRHREGVKAHYIHGNHKLEIIWTLVPAVILFWLALFQGAVWTQATQRFPAEEEAVVIEVEAFQFGWQGRYAGADGEFGTADDVLPPPGRLVVPEGRPVLIRLESRDVIHSFYLPHLRVKQDVVPGQTTRVWFQATQTGEYELACAELCGLGHFAMRGVVRIQTGEQFQAWLAEAQERPPQARAGRP